MLVLFETAAGYAIFKVSFGFEFSAILTLLRICYMI